MAPLNNLVWNNFKRVYGFLFEIWVRGGGLIMEWKKLKIGFFTHSVYRKGKNIKYVEK